MAIELNNLTDHTGSWSWEDSHVSQAFVGPDGITNKESIAIHDIVESGTVLIAAGPADLDKASSNPDGFRIVPIGLVESAQISMNKPLSRIFEIGSKLSYIIPGRTVGGISLSRVFFDGPSLLKALYMGEVKSDFSTKDTKFAKFMSNTYTQGNDTDAYQAFANIGSGNLAMNLASSFFEQPIGLSFFFKDQQSDTVGQTYFEGCRVSTYNLGISSNMNVLSEQISMEFVRCRPIVTSASTSFNKTDSPLVDKNIVSPVSNFDQGAVTASKSSANTISQ